MKKNVLHVFFLTVLVMSASAQTVINSYARITAISGTSLTVSPIASTGGALLYNRAIIMQMQDDVIGSNTANNASFGNLSTIAQAGNFEIITITAQTATTITIAAPLAKSYNTGINSRVQFISYPTQGTPNFILSTPLTSLPWDGNRGGVVAFSVPGTLTLNSSVTTTGQGFRGGTTNPNAPSDYGCVDNNYIVNNTISLNQYYAGKGEGIYPATAAFSQARGRLLSGGGGGNINNAGGGGGGNYTAGGLGGPGWTGSGAGCSPGAGGIGGSDLSNSITTSRFFLGGGGGAGQQNNSVSSPGTPGGGIIIIKANMIETLSGCSGGSVNFSAAGTPPVLAGQDGGGGGGAGGSIFFEANTYSFNSACKLIANTSGGNGASVNHSDTHGAGGGGGRGVVIFAGSATQPANSTINSTAGTGGLNNNQPGATSAGTGSPTPSSGGTGVISSNIFVLPLNITSFTAQKQSNFTAVLKWQYTSSATNDIFFFVERSSNGTSWHTISNAIKLDAQKISYQYTDPSPNKGKNFYRILQSAPNFYTAVKLLNFEEINSVNIYPNPVKNNLFIETDISLYSNIMLSDMKGKTLLFTTPVNNLNLKDVAPGLYMLTLIQKNGAQQYFKIIKH